MTNIQKLPTTALKIGGGNEMKVAVPNIPVKINQSKALGYIRSKLKTELNSVTLSKPD